MATVMATFCIVGPPDESLTRLESKRLAKRLRLPVHSDEFSDGGKGFLCPAVGPFNGRHEVIVFLDLLDDAQRLKQMRRLDSAEIQNAASPASLFLAVGRMLPFVQRTARNADVVDRHHQAQNY
jgi:hypothetical protein